MELVMTFIRLYFASRVECNKAKSMEAYLLIHLIHEIGKHLIPCSGYVIVERFVYWFV